MIAFHASGFALRVSGPPGGDARPAAAAGPELRRGPARRGTGGRGGPARSPAGRARWAWGSSRRVAPGGHRGSQPVAVQRHGADGRGPAAGHGLGLEPDGVPLARERRLGGDLAARGASVGALAHGDGRSGLGPGAPLRHAQEPGRALARPPCIAGRVERQAPAPRDLRGRSGGTRGLLSAGSAHRPLRLSPTRGPGVLPGSARAARSTGPGSTLPDRNERGGGSRPLEAPADSRGRPREAPGGRADRRLQLGAHRPHLHQVPGRARRGGDQDRVTGSARSVPARHLLGGAQPEQEEHHPQPQGRAGAGPGPPADRHERRGGRELLGRRHGPAGSRLSAAQRAESRPDHGLVVGAGPDRTRARARGLRHA